MPPLLSIAIMLAAALATAALVVAWARAWLRQSGEDRGDWERTLVDWRNLRDLGVLTDEEYRKVSTLVERRTWVDAPGPGAGRRPAAGTSGPDHHEDTSGDMN